MKDYKAYYQANRERVLARTKAWREANPDYVKRYQNEDRATRRARALRMYGNKCQCCGETEIRFLTFDHINCGGKVHRQSIGSSRQFLDWLVAVGRRRAGIRVLCLNCNFAVQFGSCPHQMVKK